MNLVLLASDTDCDGTSYSAHRITVPDTMDLTDPDAVLAYAQATHQMSSYDDSVMDILDLLTFRATYFPLMDAWHRAYFNKVGYTNVHIAPSWNPWIYDDTIGIPALDTRYED